MDTYIDLTNNEDVAVLIMVLEDAGYEFATTSFAENGNVIARVSIVPKRNPIQEGYEIHSVLESYKELATTDYKIRYEKIIADIRHLFEIDVPEIDDDWPMSDEDIKRREEGYEDFLKNNPQYVLPRSKSI